MEDARTEPWVARERSLRAGLAAAGAVLLPVALALGPVVDNDLGFHLQTGAWIARHRALTTTDPFSQGGAHRLYRAYSWLYDLGLYLLDRALGLRGVELYRLALAGLIGLALWRLARRRARTVGQALAAVVLAELCLQPGLTERPWLVSILGVVLTLDAALQLRDGGAGRALYLLPLFALWANLHVQFVYGLAVLGLAAGAAELDLRRARPGAPARSTVNRLWLLMGGAGLATLVNPAGPALYGTVFGYIRQTQPFHLVAELRPPTLGDPSLWIGLGMAAVACALWARSRPRPSFEPALLLLAAVLAVRAARDTWFPAVAALPVLVRLPLPALALRRSGAARALLALELLAAGAFGGVLAAALARQTEPFLEAAQAQAMPVGAVQFIEAQRLPGPLYNDFNWGGFLIWKLPRLPVSMDGRTNLYSDAELRAHVRTWAGVAAPAERDPALGRANLVLAPRDAPFTAQLERDPTWRLAYQDALADVLVRRVRR